MARFLLEEVIHLLKIIIMSLFLTGLVLNAYNVPLYMAIPVGILVGMFVGLVMEGK